MPVVKLSPIEAQAARKAWSLGYHEGYEGPFTRYEWPGAWPNGSRVEKIAHDPGGDMTPDGTLGTILGSLGDPDGTDDRILYFIEWDNHPKRAVGCVSNKLRRVE